MSAENLQLNPGIQPELQIPSTEAFANQMGMLAAQVPEIQAHQENIVTAGQELIDEFGISPELFDDQTHTLFFSAIADRYSTLEGNKENMDVGHYTAEKEFIGDALMLLAGDKSAIYKEIKELISADADVGEEGIIQTYDAFTDPTMTEELKQAIKDGLLDEVKARLGITDENEDPYEVRVLSIGSENSAYGIKPGMDEGLEEKDYQDPAWTEYFNDNDAFDKYEADLQTRGKEFRERTGLATDVPVAWMINVGGKRTLCLPMSFAEKILYKDEKRAAYYGEDEQARDFALLEHEYTHTQGGLNLNHDVFYGINLEERRAEYFSGDKHGYQDIKGFITDISVATGIKFLDILEQSSKGGDPAQIYTLLANEIGLQDTLEFALTAPGAYVDDARKLQKHITNYLGGPDEFTKNIYNKYVKAGHGEEIDQRMSKWAESVKGKDLDFFFEYRTKRLGLNFMTEKLREAKERAEAASAQNIHEIGHDTDRELPLAA